MGFVKKIVTERTLMVTKPRLAAVGIFMATILLVAIGTTTIITLFVIPSDHNILAAVTLGTQIDETPLQKANNYLKDARQALQKNNTKAAFNNITLAQRVLVQQLSGATVNETLSGMLSNESSKLPAQSIEQQGQGNIPGQSSRCDTLRGPSSGLC
jgi:transcriptional regulator of heat shock response